MKNSAPQRRQRHKAPRHKIQPHFSPALLVAQSAQLSIDDICRRTRVSRERFLHFTRRGGAPEHVANTLADVCHVSPQIFLWGWSEYLAYTQRNAFSERASSPERAVGTDTRAIGLCVNGSAVSASPAAGSSGSGPTPDSLSEHLLSEHSLMQRPRRIQSRRIRFGTPVLAIAE